MYGTVFVFGTKIFPETRRDIISSLPLELSWKIFSYLSNANLVIANRVCKIWQRIILGNKNLSKRLNQFELALIYPRLVRREKIHKKSRRISKKSKNYRPVYDCIVSTSKSTTKSKRGGDDIFVCTKRYRLF